MSEYFDICGTRIALSSIKDFRIIDVEFIFRPVFREGKKGGSPFGSKKLESMITAFGGRKFEFDMMQPYAAIIGQQGQKSALGEYKAKDFKDATLKAHKLIEDGGLGHTSSLYINTITPISLYINYFTVTQNN